MPNSGLYSVAVPHLPQFGAEYNRAMNEQFSSTLRTFFARLANNLNAVTGRDGGQHIDCPNGLFYSTTTYVPAAANTGYPINFENVYLHNAVERTDTTRIVVGVSGVYNFQFSGQLTSTNSSSKTVYVWLRRDGVDIGYSTRVYTLSGSGQSAVADWSFNIDMQAGQYMEIVWAASSTSVSLTATAPTAPHPGIPSAVISVNFVTSLPAILPVTP